MEFDQMKMAREAADSVNPGHRSTKIWKKSYAAALSMVKVLQKKCEWTLDSCPDYDIWNTACGQSWSFECDGIEENGVNYCHHCGGKVLQQPSTQDK